MISIKSRGKAAFKGIDHGSDWLLRPCCSGTLHRSQELLGRCSHGVAEQGRHSVADLLELLSFASREEKAIVKRLEPGRLADGDPPVVLGMDPFGQVALHLRQNGVGGLVWMQTAPFVGA